MPTATQKLKTTDECIVSSLISLVTTLSKVLKIRLHSIRPVLALR